MTDPWNSKWCNFCKKLAIIDMVILGFGITVHATCGPQGILLDPSVDQQRNDGLFAKFDMMAIAFVSGLCGTSILAMYINLLLMDSTEIRRDPFDAGKNIRNWKAGKMILIAFQVAVMYFYGSCNIDGATIIAWNILTVLFVNEYDKELDEDMDFELKYTIERIMRRASPEMREVVEWAAYSMKMDL